MPPPLMLCVAASWCRVPRCTGAEWSRATAAAPWPARHDFATAVLSAGAVVIMGGEDSLSQALAREVWKSEDGGVTWHIVAADPPWALRSGAAAVVVNDQVLLLGGAGATASFNDVWESSDAGVTFTRVNAAAPWAGRRSFGAAVLPSGDVLVLGGLVGAAASNDVWRSASGGVTWEQVGLAPWSPRTEFGCAVVGDTVVVTGGFSISASQQLADVWTSGDGGVTWSQAATAAPWGPRSSHAAVGVGGASIFVFGGTSAAVDPPSDAWVSDDRGSTWSFVATGAWPGRTQFGHGVLPDGRLIMLGGQSLLNDVWTASRGSNWTESSCASYKPGICGATPRTLPVAVSLPRAAGAVDPPNLASAASATFVYSPPVPTLELAPDQSQATTGTVRMLATFSAPVGGLTGLELEGAAVPGPLAAAIVSASATGGPTVWQLDVVVTADAQPCPNGFSLSPDGAMCATVVSTPQPWSFFTNGGCGHGTLATLNSATRLEWAAQLRETSVYDYWCVQHAWVWRQRCQ